GEADGNNKDMNYFLGLRSSDGVLVADFEEGATGPSPGLNHPIAGVTPIGNNVWHHAAVTYDGTTWRLYLNGALDAQLAVGRPPRSDSIQHASLASALTSSGTAAGFFRGVLDEVRIWNYARSAQEIVANRNVEISSASGLVGRWGLNEGSGTIANTSSGSVNGTLVNGPVWTSGFETSAPPVNLPAITRGPYLQLGTPHSLVVRWRTDAPSSGRVRFGSAVGNLNSFADNPNITTEHIVNVTGLLPDSVYFYSVGTTEAAIAGDSPSFYFATSPRIGTPVPTRIWVLGDSGTQNASQYAVRDAYYTYTGARPTDLWLMLGDNAYNNGTDSEFQGAVFNAYPVTLRNSVLWPTLGNHDSGGSTAFVDTYPYFQMFTLPANGEAGGVPSGTEHYYSFDFGNIHFICLDSMTANRATDGVMANWLRADLSSTLSDWIIAYWHHPPYTKGSHNSDTATESSQMRQNIVPILEAGGVDLVLGGHSHSYERSYLLNGHYGVSSTLSAANIVDGGSGRSPTPYQKPAGSEPHQGAVYTVAGSSGQVSGGSLNHPAMFISFNVLGSLVVDVLTNQMNVTFVDNNVVVRDAFTIVKPNSVSIAPAAPSALAAKPVASDQIDLQWSDQFVQGEGFEVERSSDGKNFAVLISLAANVTTFVDIIPERNRRYYYRVRAFNAGGSSAYSNVANAKTRRR
ncbi:MAG TPA: LamG-like jellyroll fold domain-containing protein, partial [Candidatus Limnocylindria bacterium]|nr:LamG-like jellyroll fold domain-containing protein [Candidatus Limnocylindria bacterium]